MFTVIAFDISDDRIRYRAVRLLRRYAKRVQKSVFEAPNLAPNQFRRLKQQMGELIDPQTDRVRYYFLCASCIRSIEMNGRGEVTQDREYEVL